jgi:beta-galactosidase/beta-glucuronidase
MDEWKPVEGHIMTRWAVQVDPAAPLPEYPRPQMVRPEWQNLNGLWDYAVTAKDAGPPASFEGKILVPFAIESALSGVQRSLMPEQRLWYRRFFTVPQGWTGRRILLHFEAVDWQCACFLNGAEIGSHTGGYIPFCFDLSAHLQDGENELLIAVRDPTDTHWQQRGKQVLLPNTIYYTATSGIWQTVWLEPVSLQNHIQRFFLASDIDNESLQVRIESPAEGQVQLTVYSGGKPVNQVRGDTGADLRFAVRNSRLWRPEDPFLYDLKIELLQNDEVIDSVGSYFAMRKIAIGMGPSGKKRIFLNNEPIFLHGPLDQGYWPDGGMTPPTDEAMIFDIKRTLQLGFNMTRKHVMVAPAYVMMFNRHKKDTTAKAQRKSWRESAESRADFERELLEMIEHLYNAPSIVIWVPFNESWGQYDAARIAGLVKHNDGTRLIDHVSGWFDQGVGDFCSRHTYFIKLKRPPRKDTRIYFVSEYGGYIYQQPGHLWDEKSKFGYRLYKNAESLNEAFSKLIREQLIPLISRGLGAAVYTQFSDVEIESNGLFTYDREVLKFDEQQVQALNEEIYSAFEEMK